MNEQQAIEQAVVVLSILMTGTALPVKDIMETREGLKGLLKVKAKAPQAQAAGKGKRDAES